MRARRITKSLLWLSLAIGLPFFAQWGDTPPQAAKANTHHLTILYTTDLYGQLRDFRCKRPGLKNEDYQAASNDVSNLLYKVKSIRKKIVAKNDPLKAATHGVLLFNTGDNLATAAAARFLLEFKGLAGVDFMADVFSRFGYSLIGIGNHEFSVPPDKLASFLKQSRLKYLRFSAANLIKSPPKHVFTKEVNHDGIKKTKYFIFKEAGLKIGAFHVVPKGLEVGVSSAKGLVFGDPQPVIEKIVTKLRKKKSEGGEGVDLVIMLSHLGKRDKGKSLRELLANFDEDAEKRIDLVITNEMRDDDGKPITSLKMYGTTVSRIVSGYKFGEQLGRVDLQVVKTSEGVKIQSFKPSSIPRDDNLYDPELKRELIKWERSYCKRWGRPLGKGTLRKEMSREYFMKYFVNYMRKLAGAEIGIINAKAISSGKPFPIKGFVTKDDLYRALLFPQPLYTRVMTGEQLSAIEQKDKLFFVGYDSDMVNGRTADPKGKYRVVTIEYVAENRGKYFGESLKPKNSLKQWKKLKYKNGNDTDIREMMIAHFATNDFRTLPTTPPPKPEPQYDDNGNEIKKKMPPPKPFGKNEIPLTGDFFRLDERLAWTFKSALQTAASSIFTNPINLSGFYGDSQNFLNQFYQRFQANVEGTLQLNLHTKQHSWNNEFLIGYTLFRSAQFANDTAETQNITQEERDEIKFTTKYAYKINSIFTPFFRAIVLTELTTGLRPDILGLLTEVSVESTDSLNRIKEYFLKSGETELYHRFQLESELGLTFNIEKVGLTLDVSGALRRQFAFNPFTAAKANLGLAATQRDLTINTFFNVGFSVKATITEKELGKLGTTPIVFSTETKYTFLVQLGNQLTNLLIHDFGTKNTLAFRVTGNVELALGLDIYLYRGVFKPDPNINFFQEGPVAFRIDPRIALKVAWGARGQSL